MNNFHPKNVLFWKGTKYIQQELFYAELSILLQGRDSKKTRKKRFLPWSIFKTNMYLLSHTIFIDVLSEFKDLEYLDLNRLHLFLADFVLKLSR